MNGIRRLGYIDCHVTDVERWADFMRTVFALEPEAGGDPATLTYRLGGGGQALTLRRSDRDALGRIGWTVEDAAALGRLAAHLEQAGVTVGQADPDARVPSASAGLRLRGPDGEALELYVPAGDAPAGGPPIELAHVVLASGDRATAVAWYRDMLGFAVSDHIFWDDGVEASFLRCGPRHHSIALTNLLGDMQGGDLGHFMLEAASIDEVGRGYDAALAAGTPLAFTLGRHSNDHAISFYAYTPSNWLVEFGTGGRFIDDPATETRLYDAPSLWGHKHNPPPGGDPAKLRY